MPRTFAPDEPESAICAECGWNREQHDFGNCPTRLTCGHWSNECTCGNESRTDPQPKRPPAASARFFIDHGMIHDRVTGRHVTTEPDENTWAGMTITDTCALLNQLATTNSQPKT